MPRDSAKKGRKMRGLLSSSDVSLQDFADSQLPQACGRLRKSVVGAKADGVTMKAGSQKMLEEKEREELTWFEKDLEDFVIEDDGREEDEDAATVVEEKLPRRDRKNRKKIKEEDEGITYPLDLWFHLANYIDPEDIKNFARICHDTYSITRASSFWRRLFARFYSKEKKKSLPDHLKPTSMERVHGLRARVICSMYYLYSPFSKKIQKKGPLDDEPHGLKGYRCLLAWHQPANKGWQFCFKFQRPSLKALTSKAPNKQDLYYGFNDLFFNPENGCCVLQVTCCHFASVPPVMGLLLKQVYMTLSAGFRHHRLRLHFDSSVASGDSASSDTVITLDDILAVKVLDWWHPQYPFTT